MEVITWQLVVFGTVFIGTVFLGRLAGAAIAGTWTLWTFGALSYEPLIAIQLAVAWGTWGIFCQLGARGEKIRVQQAELSELRLAANKAFSSGYSPEEKEHLTQAARNSRFTVISDRQHKTELVDALENSQSRLTISSGWIATRVVDSHFMSRLERALAKGVSVHIRYGWKSRSGNHEMNQAAQSARARLVKLEKKAHSKPNWGDLVVCEIGTHEKALVVDDEYVIVGSFNWLSNNLIKNRETSIKIFDPELALEVERRLREDCEPKSTTENLAVAQ